MRFIRNQIAFERLLRVKLSPLERYYLKNDEKFVLRKNKTKKEEKYKFDHQSQLEKELTALRCETHFDMKSKELLALA